MKPLSAGSIPLHLLLSLLPGCGGDDDPAAPETDATPPSDVTDLHVVAGAGDYAWLAGPAVYQEIRYWDEASHSERSLSEACCPTSEWSSEPPTAHDGVVIWRAWHRSGTGAHKTMMWDVAHVHEITDNDYDDSQPTLDDGLLAWQGRPGGGAGQIFYVELDR